MAIILPSGFQITNNEPADARFTVADQAARLGISPVNVYEGLLVYQRDTDVLYVLNDINNVSSDASWTAIQSSFNTGSLVTTASFNSFTASYTTGSFTGSFTGDGSGLTGIAATLSVSGSTGDGTVDLKTQAFTIAGTANEVETSMSGQTLTIGLPNNVTIAGDLTVQGTASFQSTENLLVADRFVLFASGSNVAGDGGIVVQQDSQGFGELFGYDSATTRWGFTSSFDASTATAFTPVVYVGAVQVGTGQTAGSTAPIYGGSTNGYGTIHIDTEDSEIWIYA